VSAAELLGNYGCELARRESWLAVKLTRAEFDELLAYDCSIPTGVVVGKRWRRTDRDGHWTGEMIRSIWNPDDVEVVFRPVVFVEASP
jgi:hypothetical protein